MRSGAAQDMLNSKRALAWCLIGLWGAGAAACASETGADSPSRVTSATESIDLPVPANGFQVESAGVWIEPGDDVRMCEVMVLPGGATDHYFVKRIQSALTAHGEDLIVNAAALGSETANAMDPGASLPCTRAGEAFGEDLQDVLRSQSSIGDERFPAGTGKVLQGGQKLAVEYHVINQTHDAAFAKAKLAIYTGGADDVQHLVRTASFENFTLYTPPNGTSSHVGECRVRQEMLVSDLMRRTQHYGTTFQVWRAGGEQDGELLWSSVNRGDSRTTLDTPVHLLPGEGFRFQCDYANPTGRELRYGVSAADETCTLEATFWSLEEQPSDQSEDCLLFSVDGDGIARPRS
jgi:hypothetical protein